MYFFFFLAHKSTFLRLLIWFVVFGRSDKTGKRNEEVEEEKEKEIIQVARKWMRYIDGMEKDRNTVYQIWVKRGGIEKKVWIGNEITTAESN